MCHLTRRILLGSLDLLQGLQGVLSNQRILRVFRRLFKIGDEILSGHPKLSDALSSPSPVHVTVAFQRPEKDLLDLLPRQSERDQGPDGYRQASIFPAV